MTKSRYLPQTIFRILLATGFIVGTMSLASPVTAQQTQGEGIADVQAEHDHWRGSSMGIRINRKNDDVFVDKIHDYVHEDCPFIEGDRIISVADIEISPGSLSEMGELLRETDPGTELKATVQRDDETVELVVTTFRKELVDIPVIVERLKSSAIIRKRLKDTDRPDFLDQMAERMVKAVQTSQSPRQAAEAINAIIDEIDVSHTSILPRQSFSQLTGGVSGDLGVTLQRHEIEGKPRYFVIDRMPGSPIYDSKIVLGDEIVSINGMAIDQSRRLILAGQEHRRHLFFVQVDPDEEIEVEYRRRQNSQLQNVVLQAREAIPAEDV
ncbi:MAG: PDZ domain-containing protein, partial [Pirellulaceae bacterium]